MKPDASNLFLRLHKWASRQDENFLTEVFAYLLQYLTDNEPTAAVGLLDLLTHGFFKLRPEEAGTVVVRPQVVYTEGRPDLMVRTVQQLAYVEVKSESAVDPEQIRVYLQLLHNSGAAGTQLVLLTRYPASLEEEALRKKVLFVRWYQVADWIELLSSRYKFKAVSEYLVQQFLDFLRATNMTMGQVTWELPGGVRALRTFADMLLETATACGVRAAVWGNRDCIGVNLDRLAYWLGIDFNRPEILYFSTNNRKVDREAAEALGLGSVHAWDKSVAYGWKREVDLQAEEVHFFARPKPSQMQFLEAFLRECLDLVKRIEIMQPESGPGEEPTDTDDGSAQPPK